MQNDFRGGNIPIVGCLETGGRCQWNLEQLSLGILPRLTNPLSDVTRKERLYLLGTSAIGITTIVFTGLILLRRASAQRKGQKSAKRSKTREDSMFGWGKKDKPKQEKRNVPDVEIHVPELNIDRLEIMLEKLHARVDVDATIGRPRNELVDISIGVNARIDSAQIVLEDVQVETRHRLLRRCTGHSLTSARGSGSSPGDTDGACRVAVPGLRSPLVPGVCKSLPKRNKEDNSVHQALDRGRAMLQRWGRTS